MGKHFDRYRYIYVQPSTEELDSWSQQTATLLKPERWSDARDRRCAVESDRCREWQIVS